MNQRHWLHQKGIRFLLTALIPVTFSVPNTTANASSIMSRNGNLNLKTSPVIAQFIFDDDDDDEDESLLNPSSVEDDDDDDDEDENLLNPSSIEDDDDEDRNLVNPSLSDDEDDDDNEQNLMNPSTSESDNNRVDPRRDQQNLINPSPSDNDRRDRSRNERIIIPAR